MTATIPKRHEARARYEAALANWRALDAYRHCRACNDQGTIWYEDGALPCPMCNPAGARAAAQGESA